MKRLNKILTLLLAFCMTFTLMATVAEGAVPYKTYTQNGYGEVVETQTAYTSYNILIKVGGYMLAKPTDMKITNDNTLYVSDAGEGETTAKVIVSDLDGNLKRVIGEGILKSPSGIFVNEDLGLLYVADSKFVSDQEGAVLVFDLEGNHVMTYNKPTSPLYGSSTAKFIPTKIAVDHGGTMYIVSQGNTNGVAQISPREGGTFLGYFGTNSTNISLYAKFMSLFLSKEQMKSVTQAIPSAVQGVGIDEKGLIYTLQTATGGELPLKKLNIAGVNLVQVEVQPDGPRSVAAGKYENIYVATGLYIYEYDKEGSLLFLFGGASNGSYRKGLFEMLEAIDVDDQDRVFVLDSLAKEIQIFVPTEFTDLVHESLDLYQKGKYVESKEPLQKILVMNSLFDFANRAMGQALYQEENYEEALHYFRLAKYPKGYSDAYWEVRNVGLQKGITGGVIALVILVVIYQVIARLQKKKGILNPIKNASKVVTEKIWYKRLMYGMTYIKHPIDGAYDVKRKGMCSWSNIGLYMIILIIVNVIYKYFTGFLVKPVRDGYYEVPTDILMVVVGFLFAAGCTYLVCTISDGEGKFYQILQAYLYSMTPIIIFKPIMFLVSQVVTFNEYFVIEFANVFMMAWVVILLFISIMEINSYSFKETCKIIFLTFFAAFIFIVVIFIMYVLVSQMLSFVVSLYGEVVYKIVK